MINNLIKDIKSIYGKGGFIPLHVPCLNKVDRDKVMDCLDSSFVSSVGQYVDQFESEIKSFTGAEYAVATVNGTAALHTALHLLGVTYNHEVICQPFTFIATTNAISYCGAFPVFVDIEQDYLSLCPAKLRSFLEQECLHKKDGIFNKHTKRKIAAVVMMHSFGMPGKIHEVKAVCDEFNLLLIEDAAESLGSLYEGKHTGTIGHIGIFSFNGNKIITCGGGGMLVTNNEIIGCRAKHLTTTAKIPHKWEYHHDEIGYNYRLPNLNASLAVAQMSKLSDFVDIKRKISDRYNDLLQNYPDIKLIRENENRKSNYWLNAIIFKSKSVRDKFLETSNSNNVMTRPPWDLISNQRPYKDCYCFDNTVSLEMASRIANIPSSVINYEG